MSPQSTAEQRIAIGKRLKKALEGRGCSALQLSKDTGISYPTVLHMVNGKVDLHLDDLRKIGQALCIRPSWIAWG